MVLGGVDTAFITLFFFSHETFSFNTFRENTICKYRYPYYDNDRHHHHHLRRYRLQSPTARWCPDLAEVSPERQQARRLPLQIPT
mgnify:CR=1 FL=1